MPRPRFTKLPAAQQRALLDAALDEFSTHGFHAASLNRVIDAADISKGSLYYYFDDKEDLYAHVARIELERLIAGAGPIDLDAATTPEEFWAVLEQAYLSMMVALGESPRLASLVRGWIAASSALPLQRVQQELEGSLIPWLGRALSSGQRVGAVRTDLPPGLLIAVAGGMGQAMDTWLMTQPVEPGELAPLTGALIGMIRRALEPQAD